MLWRLCDWYLKKNPPFPVEQVFEIYKAITKSLAIPNPEYVPRKKNSDPYGYEPLSPEFEQIAAMFRHLVGHGGNQTMASDYRLDFAWQGHKHEFPKYFDE